VYDSQTGLYYLNARYYNPATGRFLSEDPVGQTSSNALSYNEYAYAENNPVLLTDPSGMVPMEDEGDELGGDGAVTAGEQDAIALEVAGQGGTDAQSTGSIGEGTGESLRGASQAAYDAAENADDFTVSSKHLAGAGGRWAKFNTNSQAQARNWIRDALKSPNAKFYANNRPGSFKVITNLGSRIGTGGQTSIQIIVGTDGKIWTAYPVK